MTWGDALQTPEVTSVTYDLWFLRVTLQFKEKKEPIYVNFDGVCSGTLNLAT